MDSKRQGHRIPGSDDRRRRWPVARYALGWLSAAAIVVVTVALVMGSGPEPPPSSPAQLERAARGADCTLRRDAGSSSRTTVEVMQPPTFGPPGPAAEPGIYSRSPSPRELVGALRRGTIVVQYRPDLGRRVVTLLRREFGRPPPATIVTPDATGMRYAVAVTAWTRLLGCAAVTDDALEVAHGFEALYRNTGPEAEQ